MPPGASPPPAWLTRRASRAGWVAPATWVGHCGVGALPRPRTPSPPDRGGSRLGVRCDGFVFSIVVIYIKLYIFNQYTPGKCLMGWDRLTRPRGSGGVGDRV